jgi:hypothetical protein
MESETAKASGKVDRLRVFVGADDSQMVAARVLEFSIRRHASRPLDFTPMIDLPVPRPRDKRNRPRTGFSFYRFLIPGLCNHQGRALYLDADMLVFADLAELWNIPFQKSKVLCAYQSEAPAHWKNSPFVHLGRQFSVMLLDCARLDWDIEKIVRGLDEGRYTYSQLMSDLCVVPPDEIADAIPSDWNRLESYEAGKTKLLHYTVVSTQPWKSTENPLRGLWMEAYREALWAGAVDPTAVLRGIESGFLHPTLADDLALSPAHGTSSPTLPPGDHPAGTRTGALEHDLAHARADVAEAPRSLKARAERIADQEEAIAGLRASWARQIGRVVTAPLGRLRRTLRRAG